MELITTAVQQRHLAFTKTEIVMRIINAAKASGVEQITALELALIPTMTAVKLVKYF